MNEVKVQRNYKDSFFRMLFRDKENLLSLYNALNKTNYMDVSGLEITTLENAVYMNYKNDVSFVFDYELMIYEHQSTVNPNMPLRDLFYAADILQKSTYDKDLYGSKLIRLPSPRFVVFYNGMTGQPERKVFKLSDAYEKKQDNPELELTVTVYNINYGYNEEIMDACGTLKEYAMYVERVRIYARQMPLANAVEKAVDECIEEDILSDFLKKNRAEAIKVSIYEYDEELHFKTLREEGIEEKTNIIVKNMLMRNMPDEDIMAIAVCSQELIDQVREEQYKNQAEASNMSIYEYDEELHFKTLREEGREEGYAAGLEQGKNRMARMNELYSILLDTGRLDDLKRATKDSAYQKQLMRELLPEEMQNV